MGTDPRGQNPARPQSSMSSSGWWTRQGLCGIQILGSYSSGKAQGPTGWGTHPPPQCLEDAGLVLPILGF